MSSKANETTLAGRKDATGTGAAPAVRHVAARVHGRYLVEPARTETPAGLLVGFHGYGEDAAAHLDALRGIPGVERWHRVAVQALHRFYTRNGDVVASWMTRQDRDLAIEDNTRYVASVVAAVEDELGTPAVRVLAGFSQGVAMTWRAASGSGRPCQGVIALAGDVPPEVQPGSLPASLRVLLGRGTEDTWYTEAKMESDLETLARHGAEVESCVFPGGHEWGAEFLAAAGRFLTAVSRSP